MPALPISLQLLCLEHRCICKIRHALNLQLCSICNNAGMSMYVVSAGACSPGMLQHVSSKVGRLQVQRRLCQLRLCQRA